MLKYITNSIYYFNNKKKDPTEHCGRPEPEEIIFISL